MLHVPQHSIILGRFANKVRMRHLVYLACFSFILSIQAPSFLRSHWYDAIHVGLLMSDMCLRNGAVTPFSLASTSGWGRECDWRVGNYSDKAEVAEKVIVYISVGFSSLDSNVEYSKVHVGSSRVDEV